MRICYSRYIQRKLDEFISHKKPNTSNHEPKTQNHYKEDMNTDISNDEILNNFLDKVKTIFRDKKVLPISTYNNYEFYGHPL